MKVYRKVDAFRATRRFHRGSIGSRSIRRCRGCGAPGSRGRRPGARTALAQPRTRRASARAPRSRPTGRVCRMRSCCGAQLRQAVADAHRELPEIYRAPVVLRDIQGLTTEEASTRLKLKDQTLKSRLHRGRLMLREKLGDVHQRPALHGHAGVSEPIRTSSNVTGGRTTRPLRCDELRTLAARGDARGELERQRRHAAGAIGVDLLPVVPRPVIVVVEAGEEVDRRDPFGR